MRTVVSLALLGICLAQAGCKPATTQEPPATSADSPPAQTPPAAENNPAPAPAPMAPAPDPAEGARLSLNQKLTTTLVDARKAQAENPKLIVKEKNAFSATDPITYVSKGYFSIASQAQIAALKHQLELMKATDEKGAYPSFEVFSDLLKSSRVQLTGLYRWQVYGYDAVEGAIVILEDPDMKKAEYEKAGLDPNTAP